MNAKRRSDALAMLAIIRRIKSERDLRLNLDKGLKPLV